MTRPSKYDSNKIRERLRRQAETLIDYMDKEAPDFILASTVHIIIQCSTALFGEDLYKCMAEKAVKDARRYHATCATCLQDISPSLTYPLLCERCDHEEQESIKKLTEELGGEG